MLAQNDPVAIKSLVDLQAWDALRDHYAEVTQGIDIASGTDYTRRFQKNYGKYFDLDTWIRYHLRHAVSLGLHSAPPKRVLDLGCGAGIMLHVCRSFGHQATGLDVDNPMYMDMARVLGVDYRPDMIRLMQPLAANLTGYDVITAIAIKFDRQDFADVHAKSWDLTHWQYFLADLRNRLLPDGRAYIKPNFTREGTFFEDDRIEPYLRSIARTVTPSGEFTIPRDMLPAAV